MNSTPIYGCKGCNTTGGAGNCWEHGCRLFSVSLNGCCVQYEEIDEEMLKAISDINYSKVLTPIKI